MKTPTWQGWVGTPEGQRLLSPGDAWDDDDDLVQAHPDWFADLVGIAEPTSPRKSVPKRSTK